MKKKSILKLLFSGLVVSCAFGVSMSGRALATDPVGLTRTTLAGPTAFGEIDIHSFTPTYFAEIETLGSSDLYVLHYTIAPGGHTGWRSSPGLLLVTVTSGQATEYHGDDPHCTPFVHEAGTGFTEGAGQVHIIRNEGSSDLEIVGVVLVASGQPFRTDEADPGNCP
jgi:quercetin dioxygenase-like cupin family protein